MYHQYYSYSSYLSHAVHVYCTVVLMVVLLPSAGGIDEIRHLLFRDAVAGVQAVVQRARRSNIGFIFFVAGFLRFQRLDLRTERADLIRQVSCSRCVRCSAFLRPVRW